MSTTTLSDYKKPPLRRDDSGELDVFDATRYFSDYHNNYTLMGAKDQEVMIKEERQGYLRQGRASLDMPSLKHHHQHYYKQYHQLENHRHHRHHNRHQQEEQQANEKKKHKQPSSPGGKLAHFLNSLFNQTIMTSKKKKQQPNTTQSMKDEDENPSGRRHRRNSISHFRSANSVTDSKSLYSSSSSGFRTPPPYTLNTTTTKSCNTNNNYKQVLATFSKYKIHENSSIDEKPKNFSSSNIDNNQVKKRETMKTDELLDDGAESDASSSDLFELKIDYGFGFCSSELPVYETTHVDKIRRPPSTTITHHLPIKH